MAENNESENGESETENSGVTISRDDLTEEQIEKLMEQSEVQKFVKYGETRIPEASESLAEVINQEWEKPEEGEEPSDVYGILVRGIADRSGRITESTVHRVLQGFVEEYESVK